MSLVPIKVMHCFAAEAHENAHQPFQRNLLHCQSHEVLTKDMKEFIFKYTMTPI